MTPVASPSGPQPGRALLMMNSSVVGGRLHVHRHVNDCKKGFSDRSIDCSSDPLDRCSSLSKLAAAAAAAAGKLSCAVSWVPAAHLPTRRLAGRRLAPPRSANIFCPKSSDRPSPVQAMLREGSTILRGKLWVAWPDSIVSRRS